jgi:hypothetical protein
MKIHAYCTSTVASSLLLLIMMANVGSSAILTSSSVIPRFPPGSPGFPNPSNPNIFNLALIANSSQQINPSGSAAIVNYEITTLDENATVNPSVTVQYTSTTTITDLVISDPLGIVEVEGGGVGTYFNDPGRNPQREVTIDHLSSGVTLSAKVNGEFLNSFRDGDNLFVLQRNGQFFHFNLLYESATESISNPRSGDKIDATKLTLDFISQSRNDTYQFITSAPNTGVVPEPSTSVLALLAIGVAGRFVRKRFSTKGLKPAA